MLTSFEDICSSWQSRSSPARVLSEPGLIFIPCCLLIISPHVSPYGSTPQALAEPEVALLCSLPLLLLYSSLVHPLNLDPHNISHLVCFSNTKSYCLLRNPCSGEAALLLEHSAGLPRVLLLCWQVQVCLEQPLSLDRGTARIFLFCLV